MAKVSKVRYIVQGAVTEWKYFTNQVKLNFLWKNFYETTKPVESVLAQLLLLSGGKGIMEGDDMFW